MARCEDTGTENKPQEGHIRALAVVTFGERDYRTPRDGVDYVLFQNFLNHLNFIPMHMYLFYVLRKQSTFL